MPAGSSAMVQLFMVLWIAMGVLCSTGPGPSKRILDPVSDGYTETMLKNIERPKSCFFSANAFGSSVLTF